MTANEVFFYVGADFGVLLLGTRVSLSLGSPRGS